MTTKQSGYGPIPRPAQKRLLDAALASGDEAIEAWREWRAANDPAAIDRSSRRLLPAVYANLEAAGAAASEISGLREVCEKVRDDYRERLVAARPVLAALQDEGIEVLLLKGAALARFYGGDQGRRPMRDVDVLVRLAALDRAVAVLSGLGYTPEGIGLGCLSRHGWRVSPGWGFVAPDGPAIDLHWHVLHDSRSADAADDFWDAAVTIDFAGMAVKALCATDQFLHVCIHALQKEPLENLRWIADAMSTLRSRSEPIDWSRFLAQITRRRLLLQARYTLEYLTREFAAPIPPEVMSALRSAPVSWVEQLEFRARLYPETRGRLADAAVAHQTDVRLGDTEQSFFRALPRHLWGAAHWWQMPAWSLLDQFGVALPRAVSAPPPPHPRESGIAYEIGRRLVFHRDRSDLAALGAGWAYAELGGVWSEGALGSVVFDLGERPKSPLQLEVEIAAAMVEENGPPLMVHVLVDSSRVARWTFMKPLVSPTTYRATVPPGAFGAGDRHRIGFRILSPRSPASFGASADHRPLGIHVGSLRLGKVA